MTAREATAITLCALFILFGLLLFKALDPRPRCDSLLLAISYDTDNSCPPDDALDALSAAAYPGDHQ